MKKELIVNNAKKKFNGELLDIVLKQTKSLFPNCYICNLDGKIIDI